MKRHAFALLTGDFSNNLKVHNFLLQAATNVGASILQSNKHEFYPQGVTCVVLLAESHITIHTYPEDSQAYVDCFTCGNLDPRLVIQEFKILMEATSNYMDTVER